MSGETSTNICNINNGSEISLTSVAYLPGSTVISGGGSQLPTISNSGNNWKIQLNCDRNGSSSVADQFKNALNNNASYMFSNSAHDSEPGELNFFFAYVFVFEGSSQQITIYLGQGHQWDIGNNWWMGSPNISTTQGQGYATLSGDFGSVRVVMDSNYEFSFITPS